MGEVFLGTHRIQTVTTHRTRRGAGVRSRHRTSAWWRTRCTVSTWWWKPAEWRSASWLPSVPGVVHVAADAPAEHGCARSLATQCEPASLASSSRQSPSAGARLAGPGAAALRRPADRRRPGRRSSGTRFRRRGSLPVKSVDACEVHPTHLAGRCHSPHFLSAALPLLALKHPLHRTTLSDCLVLVLKTTKTVRSTMWPSKQEESQDHLVPRLR